MHIIKEHKTNEYVWELVNIRVGRQEVLLSTVERHKLSWFGHVCRHDTLPRIIGIDRPVIAVVAVHRK